VHDLTPDDVARLADVVDGASNVQHVGGAGDSGQRIAKLVAEHRQEIVLRPVGRLRLFQQQDALGFGPLAIADVTRDLRRAHDGAAGIANR
jgi:hypothetical protein